MRVSSLWHIVFSHCHSLLPSSFLLPPSSFPLPSLLLSSLPPLSPLCRLWMGSVLNVVISDYELLRLAFVTRHQKYNNRLVHDSYKVCGTPNTLRVQHMHSNIKIQWQSWNMAWWMSRLTVTITMTMQTTAQIISVLQGNIILQLTYKTQSSFSPTTCFNSRAYGAPQTPFRFCSSIPPRNNSSTKNQHYCKNWWNLLSYTTQKRRCCPRSKSC